MSGYIKDYRQEMKSDIWIMPPLYYKVWQWIKYSVNHSDNEIPMKDGTKYLIKKGQKLTSYRNIAKDLGWYEGLVWKEPNSKTVKTICDWLEKNNMITQEHGKSNRQYTLITVVNWDLYQGKDKEGVTTEKQESNTEVTDEKQLADINKNDKECLKNNNKYSFESNEFRLSKLLQELILNNDSKNRASKAELQKWAINIDKLIKVDGRDVNEIEAVIRWSQQNEFWKSNILSTDKLRKKFDTLKSQMENSKTKNKSDWSDF